MRYPGVRGERARSLLTLLALGMIGAAAIAFPRPARAIPVSKNHSDVAMFKAVVDRLKAGSSYYGAYGTELRRTGYPSLSPFNWRTPFLLSAVAVLPKGLPAALAGGLLLALLGALCRVLAASRERSEAVWVGGMMELGALAILAVPSAVVLGEAGAGVLIGLSVWAYAGRRAGFGVVLGLLALFIRELAAPYCIVCTLIAARNRRWRELVAWIAGACAYAAYYGWHVTQIWAHRLPTDWAEPSPWLGFPGLPFLMATVHWQGWLLASPAPLAALALVLIVAGIAHPRAPLHLRLGSAAYVGFFLAAGRSYNDYWGLVAWPTWAAACGYGADTTMGAIRTAFRPASETCPPSGGDTESGGRVQPSKPT